ncbi:MAG: UDP-glucose 4-epimerase GalE [Clostridia bacterium]|nr:UDP-glucose 4-epimerase GalE [Clostridia bacterium]
MKVLLTGGLGYIGSHTAVELINEGFDVEIMDNLYNSNINVVEKLKKITNKEVKFYKIDLLDVEGMDNLFKQGKYDAVIHFAGLKAVGESSIKPLMYYENNITGTINLLKAMEKYKVNNLVFSSSACVYSDKNVAPFHEEDIISPINPYGRTKYFIEEIIKDYANANKCFKAVILRYFNPIGAHESGLIGENPNGIPNNLMPYIARVAFGKLKELSVFGNDYDTPDGTGVRDYIHVVDLAKGHVAALNHIKDFDGYKIYNLGTGHGYSVLDVVNAFNKVCGNKVNYKIVDRRPGDAACVYACPDKAYKDLGFKTTKTLDEMCYSSYNFEKNNKD